MGRPAKGPQIKWKRGWAYCHFTWQGREYREALGTKDQRQATEASARAYAAVVSGQRPKAVRRTRTGLDLADLFDAWIESKRNALDPTTVPTLEGYARRFIDFFDTLDGITEASASTYGLARLGQGLRTTVLRELAYLRQFLEYCQLHGYLTHAPKVPKLPPKAKGTRTGKQRAKFVHVTSEEARAILDLLPEESKTIRGRKWPLRARFEFMWETALRPETLSRLTVPDNWRPGAKHVELADDDDKARYGREVDLTPKALRILAKVAPKAGPVFGRSNYSKALKRAAIAVLGPIRGKSFAPYDFRHGRAKALLDDRAAIRGVAYVLGHKRVTTTDKYLAPDRAAGAKALRVSGPNPDQRRRRDEKLG